MGLCGIAITTYLTYISNLRDTIDLDGRATMRKIDTESAIETFLQAYRLAQVSYLQTTAGCPTANSFAQALQSGSNCAAGGTVWSGTSPMSDLFSYPGGGCQISTGGSSCAAAPTDVVTIGVTSANQSINHNRFKITFLRSWPEFKNIEFLLTNLDDPKSRGIHFVINDFFQNLAHMENDGRVTQENPLGSYPCAGQPWATYQVLDPNTNSCRIFAQLGGGSGLAFYQSRYFGFRPADGLVIDLLAAAGSTNPSTYAVDYATGTIGGGGDPVFPPYPNPNDAKVSLLNVDDLTTIQNQIYYVSGQGPGAQIGFVAPDGTRTIVCQLGQLGWAQSYSGIAALSWSDALLRNPSDPLDGNLVQRLAVFYLKTTTGDLLNAAVLSDGNSNFSCAVTKNTNVQQVEYRRTDGFDRVIANRPFDVF